MGTIAKGSWVEIEQVVLRPEERAATLPEDTKLTPLVMRVSGFLVAEAAIGEPSTVRTLAGRELSGRLRTVNPGYGHGFGTTVVELLDIGKEDRP